MHPWALSTSSSSNAVTISSSTTRTRRPTSSSSSLPLFTDQALRLEFPVVWDVRCYKTIECAVSSVGKQGPDRSCYASTPGRRGRQTGQMAGGCLSLAGPDGDARVCNAGSNQSGGEIMARAAVREPGRDAEVGVYPEGAAFIDGEVVPIAEARIPILDWGFLRSDCTYDVVHVWRGRFFRLDHHLDRFERSAAGLRLENPYSREQVVAILMRLDARDRPARGLCRGDPDPRHAAQGQPRSAPLREPLLRLRDPVRLDRDRGDARARASISTSARCCASRRSSVDPAIKNFHWGDLMQGPVRSPTSRGATCRCWSTRRATSPKGRASTSSRSRTAG